MNKCLFLTVCIVFLSVAGCKESASPVRKIVENREAKAMLQGIWVDSETENAVFKVEGDTIFYPDTVSQPAVCAVMEDTLCIGRNVAKYPVVKLTRNVFWFKDHNDDVVKLVKSADSELEAAFQRKRKSIASEPKKLKSDTVVIYNNERYHCYIAVNPTTYKVVKTSYTDNGMKVGTVYYDNIIHVSVFQGAKRLYSRDFNKRMCSRFVPASFLSQAILSNMEFSHVDSKGFHFNTIVCIPDGASCYMLDTVIGFEGQMSMELIEY